MRGIIRVALLMCSYTTAQRWLIAGGLGLLALGLIDRLADPHASNPVGFVAALMGLAAIVLALMLLLGQTLRAISAPRTLALIPYARTRCLLASLLVVLALAAFLAGIAALLELDVRSQIWTPMPPGVVFAGAFGAGTLMTLDFFYMSASSFSPLLYVILGGCGGGLWVLLNAHVAARGISTPELVLLLAAGAWSGFAVWYLSARSISSPVFGWGGVLSRRVAGSERKTRLKVSAASAANLQLLGLPSAARLITASDLPLIIGAVLIAIPLAMAVKRHPGLVLPTNASAVYMVALFFWLTIPVALPTAVAASRSARRCRGLWLQSGCTRSDLFRVCEGLGWRCFGAVGAPVWALCAVLWLVLPHPTSDWRYLVVAAFAPSACALYVGLMSVQGWRWVTAAAALLILPVALGPLMAAPRISHATAIPWIIVIAEALGAVGLRTLAQRRWRRIDWLIGRPRERRPAF